MHYLKKRLLIFGILFVVVFLGVVITSTIQVLQQKQHTASSNLTSPTPLPNTSGNIPPSPPPLPGFYKQDQTNKMLQTIEHRPALSQNDTTVRTHVLIQLNNQSGTLYSTDAFIVTYVQAADLFQVEILTSDITKAKADAVAWFASQGFTQQGVCQLPVTFYLSFPILQEVKQQNIQFDPIPDNC